MCFYRITSDLVDSVVDSWALTWVCVKPSDAANSARSGSARYCVRWKRLFNCCSCKLEYIVRGLRNRFILILFLFSDGLSSALLVSFLLPIYIYIYMCILKKKFEFSLKSMCSKYTACGIFACAYIGFQVLVARPIHWMDDYDQLVCQLYSLSDYMLVSLSNSGSNSPTASSHQICWNTRHFAGSIS